MDIDFKDLIIGAVLIGLFIVAIVSFNIYNAENYDNATKLTENEAFNSSFNDMSNELEGIQSTAESQKTSFFKDIPVIGEVSIVLSSIVGIAKSISSVMRNIYNLTLRLIAETLGIPVIILNVITGMIIISTILLAWKLYRSGK